MGAQQILAAILNRYFNFNNPNDLAYVYFYVAEVATAIYVGNIPLCWPLVQLVFRTGPWPRGSASDSQQQHMQQARQPRTRADKSSSRRRAKTNTEVDVEGGSSVDSASPYLCPANVNGGQTSTVELTRPWGDSGADLHTEVHASRGATPENESVSWPADDAQGHRTGRGGRGQSIVKTVQISATVTTAPAR